MLRFIYVLVQINMPELSKRVLPMGLYQTPPGTLRGVYFGHYLAVTFTERKCEVCSQRISSQTNRETRSGLTASSFGTTTPHR